MATRQSLRLMVATAVAVFVVGCVPEAPTAPPAKPAPSPAAAKPAESPAAKPAASPAAKPKPADPGIAQLVEGARREGKLVAWISTPKLDPTHRGLIAAFNKRFGLSLELEWLPLHSNDTMPRLIAEGKAGLVSADVVGSGSARQVQELVQAGVLRPYNWIEVVGSEFPGVREPYERVVSEHRGTALSQWDSLYGMMYNTEQITRDRVPTRYEALADPAWRGRFIVNTAGGAPLTSSAWR